MSKSAKSTVKILLRTQRSDLRSTFGRNCENIRNICDVQNIKDAKVNQLYPVPDGEEWRLPVLKELMNIRDGALYIQTMQPEELTVRIGYICCS